ncbi:hypothetical protein GGF32_004222 [Allomyces javanicus]|nr:hypothetical protein GGF32_004222 [Allomyces javanicus]
MDVFMHFYYKDSLFAGRVPATAQDFFKTFSIHNGMALSSSNFVARIGNLVDDLTTTGKVASTRLSPANADFTGRSLQPLLDQLKLTDGTDVTQHRHQQRLSPVSLLSFVENVVASEFDLLRCDLLRLHLSSLTVLLDVLRLNVPLMKQVMCGSDIAKAVKDVGEL